MKFFTDCREWGKLYSIRLAAAVSAVVGLLTTQPEVLFAVIGFIPTDPLTRAIFAVAVAALTFSAPALARLWPQGDKDKTNGK